MILSYNNYTDIGNRDTNEDSVAFIEKSGSYCFVLCDGLGGHGKGELASRFVCDSICRCFEGSTSIDSFFDTALERSQEALLNEQKKLNAPFEMKTTAVVLVLWEDMFRYAYIGDSRLYHFRKNKVRFRTLDHSVPQMLALAGDISEKQIRTHPDRNRLLRVMGVKWDAPRYEVSDVMSLKSKDAFLLCSDGFWEQIIEKDMCKLLKKSSDAGKWIESMSAVVKENGKTRDMDNNSAIVIMVEEI